MLWRLLMLLVCVGGLCACTGPHTSTPAASPPSSPRNLILILADDMGYGDLGASTPHLNQLARDGVQATACYTAQPVCSASRAAILTGCYPNRVGISGALGPSSRVGLSLEEETLAELCQRAGMRTALYGKWHLGAPPHHSPTQHGFDEWFGVPYSHDMWPYHPESPQAWPPLPHMRGVSGMLDEVVSYNDDPSLWTQRIKASALRYIETHAQQRFCLYLPLPMPHVPLAASANFRGRSSAGVYGDVLLELDDLVGALRQRLRDLGIEEETLVVFTSDNGPWLSYGTHAGSTGGLREGKGSVWEGGIRVPFLAACPGSIPPGTQVDTPFMLTDVLPTAVEALGLAAPRLTTDGRSVWPLLCGTTDQPPHELLGFWYERNELQAVRCGPWKLVYPHHYRRMPEDLPKPTDGRPWSNSTGTVVRTELYNLLDDPNEAHDVAYAHPEVVRRIDELAEQLRADLGDSLRGRKGSGARQPALSP